MCYTQAVGGDDCVAWYLLHVQVLTIAGALNMSANFSMAYFPPVHTRKLLGIFQTKTAHVRINNFACFYRLKKMLQGDCQFPKQMKVVGSCLEDDLPSFVTSQSNNTFCRILKVKWKWSATALCGLDLCLDLPYTGYFIRILLPWHNHVFHERYIVGLFYSTWISRKSWCTHVPGSFFSSSHGRDTRLVAICVINDDVMCIPRGQADGTLFLSIP